MEDRSTNTKSEVSAQASAGKGDMASTLYSTSDLVSFGNYLLLKRLGEDSHKRFVTDADIANWTEKEE